MTSKIVTVVLLATLAALLLAASCQKATVRETYERTPAKAASKGEGLQEYRFYQFRGGRWCPITDPFVVVVPRQEDHP